MLIHEGPRRTPNHNLLLASLLGLTAGFVNAEGFLGFSVLTTNVTGHAAVFAERMAFEDWHAAQVIAVWMFLFLSGAFFSSFILSIVGKNQRFSYVIPITLEIGILLFAAKYGYKYDGTLISKEIFAGSLLFAMGSQNALVSLVSGSAVRTTHLTGTFTDLGIELAQILRKDADRHAIRAKIKLRLVIITFFMTGAIVGAILFHRIHFPAFFAPIGILVFVLFYDVFRVKAIRYYRTRISILKKTIHPQG